MKSLFWLLVVCFIYQQVQSSPTSLDLESTVQRVASFADTLNLGSAQPCFNMSSALLDIAAEVFNVQQFYGSSTEALLLDLDRIVLCGSLPCVEKEWAVIKKVFEGLVPQIETFKAQLENYVAIVEDNWLPCFGN